MQRVVRVGLIGLAVIVVFVLGFMSGNGWRANFGAAPIERTVAMASHPTLPRTAQVYIARIDAGYSVRCWVYVGEPDWISYGDDVGEIGVATSFHDAAKRFGAIRWTVEGMRVGQGLPDDPVVLTPDRITSYR